MIRVRILTLLRFEFVLSQHGERRKEYGTWRSHYIRAIPEEALSITAFKIISNLYTRESSENPTLSTYGVEDHALDVSSGQYAKKKFLQAKKGGTLMNEVHALMRLRHASPYHAPKE